MKYPIRASKVDGFRTKSYCVVTNKHTAKLHHVGSLYILTYDARKLKHKMLNETFDERKDNLQVRKNWSLDWAINKKTRDIFKENYMVYFRQGF